MGKSILVIDTPECCMECPMCFHADDLSIGKFEYKRLYSCRLALSDAEDFYLPDILGQKPDWCPLQEASEKKDKNPYHNQHESGYVDGWNDCLGATLDSDDHGDSEIQVEKDCANCVCSSCSHKTECCEDCEGAIRDCEERNAPYT